MSALACGKEAEPTAKPNPFKHIVLGFTEDATENTNRPEQFASKVGGRPVWLYRGQHLGPKAPRCEACGQIEKFLCQIYAPIDEGPIGHEGAFHRMLYVTVCTSSGCTARKDGKGATVLRAQLPRDNPFYPFTAISDDDDVSDDKDCEKEHVHEENEHDEDCHTVRMNKTGHGTDDSLKDECALCGFWGELICGGCRMARYCSKQCQRIDWKLGHSTICRGGKCDNVEQRSIKEEAVKESRRKWRLPELEIVTDQHCTPPTSDYEESDDDGSDGEEVEVDASSCLAGTIGGSMQDATQEELPEDLFKQQMGRRREQKDKVADRFQKIVRYEPDQVIRYDRNGTVLWAQTEQQCDESGIGKCELCGGKRRFEMQIMSQIVYIVERERTKQSKKVEFSSDLSRMVEVERRMHEDMDWATIVIYSCENSCELEIGQYTSETGWVQRN